MAWETERTTKLRHVTDKFITVQRTAPFSNSLKPSPNSEDGGSGSGRFTYICGTVVRYICGSVVRFSTNEG